MRIRVDYKAGGAFEVEADTEEEVEVLLNTALRVLWGKRTEAMSLDETAQWLGWTR